MPAKYQTIGGVATLVQHRGRTTLPGAPPDTSTGPVVVCLHDAGMGGGSFAGVLDALAADHCPIAFDRPGHGRSGGLDSLDSVAALADHARRLVEAYDLAPAVIVGEGLGSAIALELAIAAPTAVAGLVLIGGAAASWDVADEIEALAAVTAGRARRAFDRAGYGPDTDRSVYQAAFGIWVATDPRAALGERRAQAGWSLGDRADRVMAPARIVVGEYEEPDSVVAAEALAGSLPRATLVTLAGAGRRGVLERPVGLADVVASLAGSSGR